LSAGPDRRLTRDRRLRKAAEFSRVFARPQRVHSESFTVLARENERSEPVSSGWSAKASATMPRN